MSDSCVTQNQCYAPFTIEPLKNLVASTEDLGGTPVVSAGLLTRARATATRCCCPPNKLVQGEIVLAYTMAPRSMHGSVCCDTRIKHRQLYVLQRAWVRAVETLKDEAESSGNEYQPLNLSDIFLGDVLAIRERISLSSRLIKAAKYHSR